MLNVKAWKTAVVEYLSAKKDKWILLFVNGHNPGGKAVLQAIAVFPETPSQILVDRADCIETTETRTCMVDGLVELLKTSRISLEKVVFVVDNSGNVHIKTIGTTVHPILSSNHTTLKYCSLKTFQEISLKDKATTDFRFNQFACDIIRKRLGVAEPDEINKWRVENNRYIEKAPFVLTTYRKF